MTKLISEKLNIPYARQSISQGDIDAVIDVLNSKYLTQGPMVPAFENFISTYVGSDHAFAFNSATSALHVACLALGVTSGDIVWTSPNTFVASSNCALYCGAAVDFVDIDPLSYNLSCDRLEEKLILAKKSGSLPKVVIPVHFCGQPCDMRAIHRLSKIYGFRIIEDASHAIGAEYESQKVGIGKFSDITIFSFHPVKIITSAEGGMAVTNDKNIASKLRLLRSHGITNSPDEMYSRPEDEIWNYQQIDLGFNYRMSDIHAALGLKQIERIDGFLSRRRAIALRYDQELQGLPVSLPFQIPSGLSSYHLYPIRLHLDEIKKTQKEVWASLYSAGVLVNLLYIPVYLQPYYESLGFKRGYCTEAEKYFRETISIPMYPDLTDDQQGRVIEAIRGVLLS
tara:strand:- start:1599 stop:2789 length:1191 start_codon:yes stop_codon:yes gene_type:complete